MQQVLTATFVQPGDVLLCRSNHFGGEVADVTGSKYLHAAICTRPNIVAEASGIRVKEIEIEALFDLYDHIAVLHQPGWWSQRRVDILQGFVNAAISRKAKFNSLGIRNFEEQKRLHKENLYDKLHEYFEGTNNAGPPAERDSYFCSELVAAAHVAVGILDPGAGWVYDPSVQSPGEMANDFTFGIFAGYLIPYPDYQIPDDDEFSQVSTVSEIFNPET